MNIKTMATDRFETTRTIKHYSNSIQRAAEASVMSQTGSLDLCEAIEARAYAGFAAYGGFLAAHNGHAPMVDALQELVDAIVYLQQASAEAETREHSDLICDRQEQIARIACELIAWIKAGQ